MKTKTDLREKAERASELINQLAEIALEKPFVSFSEANEGLSIHVYGLKNLASIGHCYIINSEIEEFPYRAYLYVNGVEFFALLTQAEYEKSKGDKQ